jgi:hypothetical protein
MRWGKQMLVLLLVAMWLPASSHALLQQAGWIHQMHDHESDVHSNADHSEDSDGRHEHDMDNHAAADGLCLVASVKVQLSVPDFVSAPGWLTLGLSTSSIEPDGNVIHSGLSPPGVAPPELQHQWQFSLRTALPARAPSRIS